MNPGSAFEPVQPKAIIYVDLDAPGAIHDGSSWCTAFPTLHQALSVSVSGSTIRLADGLYTPDPTGLPDARDATFPLRDGVMIEGGYAGCGSPDPDWRDITLFETVLSGDVLGNDDEVDPDAYQTCCSEASYSLGCQDAACEAIVCAELPVCCESSWGPACAGRADQLCNGLCDIKADNSFQVVTALGVGPTGVLSGVLVESGNADGTDESRNAGGGMYVYGGNPTVASCIFRRNEGGRAEAPTLCCCEHPGSGCVPSDCETIVCSMEPACCTGPWTSDCVGIAFIQCFELCKPGVPCNPTLTGGGGGVCVQSGALRLTNSVFAENTSNAVGGGLLTRNSNLIVTSCTFDRNLSWSHGGGAYSDSTSQPVFTGCAFMGNTSYDGGGGIFIGASSGVTLSHCIFLENVAWVFGGGASLFGELDSRSSPRFTNCTFLGNRAILGGGIHTWRASPSFINCAFNGNAATLAGGGLTTSQPGTTQFVNCTISNNRAEGLSWGGGMYVQLGDAVLNNCILWGNWDEDGIDEETQFKTFGSTSLISYSCIQGYTGTLPWSGVGNLADDPRFADPAGADGSPGTADDDLRLTSGSPCIDAGSNSAVPPSVVTDLDGNPRIVNGTVDMGAYEFPCVSVPALPPWARLEMFLQMLLVGGLAIYRRIARAIHTRIG